MIFTSQDIRLLRTSRQMMQKEVAKKMGISNQRYSELENHNRLRPERVKQILTVLGFSLETARKYLDSIPPKANMYEL